MKKLFMVSLFVASTAMVSAQVKIPEWINNVKFSGYGMTQYQWVDQEGSKANSFNLRLVRLALEGRIAKDFYWKMQLQVNGNTSTLGNSPRIVDCFSEWQKYEFFRVKLGQFKRSFTFENPLHPITEGFYTYSQAISKLSGFSDRSGEQASNGRDIGLQFQGDFLKNNAGRNLLHYQIGIFNGQGINQKDVDQQKDVIGGLWVMPIKGMRIGAFGWTGSYARKGSWTEKDASGNSVTHTNEVRSLQKRRYAISGEYLIDDWTFRTEYLHNTGYGFKSTYQKATEDCEVNYTNGNKADAYYAAVIAPIIKDKLHAKVRYDLYRANGEWNKANTLYEVGADYEFTKNFQINAEYALVNNRANTADKNSNMIDVQVDFKF
jgi:hypothetical protein